MKRHPLFARLYARLAPLHLTKGEGAKHRAALLAGLRGRVLEIGAGSGLNFAFYPREVTDVVALEPEPYLRARAAEAARAAPVPVEVTAGAAEDLPFGDGTFDGVVFSLVLCSVADQGRALSEARRVLRPGGELRAYEHVLASAARLARWQQLLDRSGVWPLFSGGCHPNRDTVAAIVAAGFEVIGLDRFYEDLGPLLAPASPHILARARAPQG